MKLLYCRDEENKRKIKIGSYIFHSISTLTTRTILVLFSFIGNKVGYLKCGAAANKIGHVRRSDKNGEGVEEGRGGLVLVLVLSNIFREIYLTNTCHNTKLRPSRAVDQMSGSCFEGPCFPGKNCLLDCPLPSSSGYRLRRRERGERCFRQNARNSDGASCRARLASRSEHTAQRAPQQALFGDGFRQRRAQRAEPPLPHGRSADAEADEGERRASEDGEAFETDVGHAQAAATAPDPTFCEILSISFLIYAFSSWLELKVLWQ